MLAGDVPVVRDGRSPHAVPHGAATGDDRGISCGGASDELTVGLEHREHHTIVVEQPEVVCCQVIGIDVVSGEPTDVLARVEALAVPAARELARRAVEAALQAQADSAEKKGRRAARVRAAGSSGTRGTPAATS